MCGIAGWTARPGHRVEVEVLDRVTDRLAHRGPDDRGVYLAPDGQVGLGHRRLSIIDLSEAGHQPMVSPDGRFVLVYNGELYNSGALREDLQCAGYEFVSQCDTEVVLLSFMEWGRACLDRFRGMFALGLFDTWERRLLLARDFMGMKPLYYRVLPEGTIFASELVALLEVKARHADVDKESLREFMEFGYGYRPEASILAGIQKLPPGHWLELSDGQPAPATPYAAVRVAVANDPVGRTVERDAVAELHETLDQVVAEHLIADVPVALLLSGGLDSSLLAALAAKRGPLVTVSMGFGGSAVDERPHARRVSEYIGSKHIEVQIDPEDVISDLPQAVRHFDDLFADWGLVSTRQLYGRCRELGIEVVLVGEGADELFGGYDVFEYAARLQGRFPQAVALFLLYRRYAGRRWGLGFPGFRRVMSELLAKTDDDLFQAVRLFESRHQLPNNYVMKVDKASMSVGVEARAPYLDRRVAELAYGMHTGSLMDANANKRPLREVAARYGLLPPETISRRKFGASIASSWMDDSASFRAYARELILGERGGWVDLLGYRNAMTAYFDRGVQGFPFPHPVSVFRNLAWRLVLLVLWTRELGIRTAVAGDSGR